MAIKTDFKPKEVTKKLLKALPERSADILVRRYGLGKSVRRETLESVGRSYGITRERVRQIENGALVNLRKSDAYKNQLGVFVEIAGVIKDLGGVVSEEKLLSELSSNESVQNHIHFLLVLSDMFTKLKENADFVHRWYEDKFLAQRVHEAIEKLHKKIRRDELLAQRDIINKLLNELGDVDTHYLKEDTAMEWLSLSKRLARNQLGDWGKVGSPGIHMRGIRDMAWLVLRKHGSPMHYTEVAKAIEDTFGRKTNSATCHNELIKDDRFVLVGRGLYALSEWGYSDGLVKDVLRDILKKHGPLSKKDLMDMVKRERYVKSNTIMINLQDSEVFGVDERGFYYAK